MRFRFFITTVSPPPGEDADSRYSRPRDLDLIQSTPVESVALMAPPRVLTLNEQPLDFLEPDPSTASQENPEVTLQGLYYTVLY